MVLSPILDSMFKVKNIGHFFRNLVSKTNNTSPYKNNGEDNIMSLLEDLENDNANLISSQQNVVKHHDHLDKTLNTLKSKLETLNTKQIKQ